MSDHTHVKRNHKDTMFHDLFSNRRQRNWPLHQGEPAERISAEKQIGGKTDAAYRIWWGFIH